MAAIMVQHVLLPVNIHFHWNLFIFEFLTIFLIFILATILKTKSTTLSDDLFLCQVSKGSAVWSEFNIFLHFGYHGNGRHFEFFSTPQKLPHTTVDIPTKIHEVWWKESPFFLFPWQLLQSLSNRFRFFLAYLVPLDVDVFSIKFHQFLFGE